MTVRLTVDDITTSPVIGFAGKPDPTITSIQLEGVGASFSSVSTAGGENIIIIGTGFSSNNYGGDPVKVYIDDREVSPVTSSSTVVLFTTPPKTPGTYSLYIVNPNGTITQSIPGITYSN